MTSEVFIRPSGKIYRPRKNDIEVREFDHWGDHTAIVVFGTHDVEKAVYKAFHEINEFELDPYAGSIDWWRTVPWDHSGYGYDFTYISDPVRGRPCVVFDTLR